MVQEPLLPKLPKKRPDRIYGLQQTENFARALKALAPSRELRSSPFGEGSEPLLYPFLIVEAKSQKSGAGFDAIEMQTAFPIRTLLKLQHDLNDAVGESPGNSPLIWFFANRGEDWRLYCGYETKVDNMVKNVSYLPLARCSTYRFVVVARLNLS